MGAPRTCDICRAEEARYEAKNHLVGSHYALCSGCLEDGLDMAKISVLGVKPLEQEEVPE